MDERKNSSSPVPVDLLRSTSSAAGKDEELRTFKGTIPDGGLFIRVFLLSSHLEPEELRALEGSLLDELSTWLNRRREVLVVRNIEQVATLLKDYDVYFDILIKDWDERKDQEDTLVKFGKEFSGKGPATNNNIKWEVAMIRVLKVVFQRRRDLMDLDQESQKDLRGGNCYLSSCNLRHLTIFQPSALWLLNLSRRSCLQSQRPKTRAEVDTEQKLSPRP